MTKKYRCWLEPKPIPIPPEIKRVFADRPLLADELVNHGIHNIVQARAYLNPAFYSPQSSQSMPGIERSAERVIQAIKTRKTIGIWGDFDVDGQTATALLVSFLKAYNAKVQYHIPVRAVESHGMQLKPLANFLNKNIDLIITCDTGISANKAIHYAQKNNVDVIITDHHDLPPEKADAFAIINPKLLNSSHPLRYLSGVGTAFQLVQYISEIFPVDLDVQDFLDLVALGTVADVSRLIDENRYYVQKGIRKLKENKRLGIRELLTIAEVNANNITEEEISYVIAPRLNAIGRLGDANSMVEFLTTNDQAIAKQIATMLEGFNNQRRLLVNQVYKSAISQIKKEPSIAKRPIVILWNPNWPSGVIGIVASRIVEMYQRPVILFSNPPGELARGSARSIEGVDIQKAISANKNLLISFGGHPMAAGLAIEPHLLQDFQSAIIGTINALKAKIPFQQDLQIDAYIPLVKTDENLVNVLDQLAPYGPGNPKPIFVSRNVQIIKNNYLGNSKEHLLLQIKDLEGKSRKVIWWKSNKENLPKSLFDLAYSVRSRVYKGKREIQLEWIDFKESENESIEILKKTRPIKVKNLKYIKNLKGALSEISEKDGISFWAENFRTSESNTNDRYHLKENQTVYTKIISRAIQTIRLVMQTVNPKNVYLLGFETAFNEKMEFIKQIAGFIKYVINKKDGLVSIQNLAAASGQTEKVVQKSLAWLKLHGDIQIRELGEGEIAISAGGEKDVEEFTKIDKSLIQFLAETAAFRRYYMRTDPHMLINKIMQ